jgi:tetratricopeptide (TPR) repeat protein
MDNFRDIIKKIKICRNRGTSEEVISCLKDLFYEIGDGMVAYAMGEELEKIGKFEEALKYFAEAKVRFPWPKYQDMARITRERVKRKIESEDLKKESRPDFREEISGKREPTEKSTLLTDISDRELTAPSPLDSDVLIGSLIITACTKEKIWDILPDAPDYVPAIMACTGKGFLDFLKWARMEKINEKGCFWFI